MPRCSRTAIAYIIIGVVFLALVIWVFSGAWQQDRPGYGEDCRLLEDGATVCGPEVK